MQYTSSLKRVRDIQALHRTFLQTVLNFGRVHELFLIIGYKLRTGHWLQDAQLGPAMWQKDKLHLLPDQKPGTERVRCAIEKLKGKP